MAPRKKQHGTESAKQAAWAERQQQAGKRRVCLWLSREAADELKARAAGGRTQAAVIEGLLLEGMDDD
jgi:hypothetical protein